MALKSNRVGVRTDQVDEYGRVISSSFLQSILDHLPRWTSLKVWKNGTEQLLPVNTDEPVTSPIVADIQYPTDSSATEQMFTYRESPTEADGEAYIQSIKGNTIVWNQLIQNGNFSDGTNGFSTSRATLTASDGVLTITKDQDTVAGTGYAVPTGFTFTVGHKYLAKVDYKGITGKMLTVFSNSAYSGMSQITPTDENWHTYYKIFDVTAIPSVPGILWLNYSTTTDDNVAQFKNYAIFDLTAMFGSTKADEILAMETAQAGSGVAYFRSLFPLPYYQYDAGSLLSFNGTGIKTVGKNLCAETNIENGSFNPADGSFTPGANYRNVRLYLLAGTYTISTSEPFYYLRWWDGVNHSLGDSLTKYTFTMNKTGEFQLCFRKNDSSAITEPFTVQVEFGSTVTTYEPYTTSTTTIPTDTYFPTGMKSAGTVYDEFNSSRAYTRIGEVDLGSLGWTVNSTYNNIFQANLAGCKQGVANQKANILCAKYETEISGANSVITTQPDKTIRVRANSNVICILDSTYSTAEALTTALDGVYLYYELAEEIIEPTLTFDEE